MRWLSPIMLSTLPEFGTLVLCAVLVAAAYTLAVALGAAAGHPRWLGAARLGTYGTIALVGLGVAVLAYAFIAHDFRVRYVAHYSDRSMGTALLFAALWGGQDGSLLWWLFLTCVFTGAFVYSMRGRYRELQPLAIAVLMVVLLFLALVVLFAVNPFATLPTGAPPDGRGLNYQLRNFYMIVHPPSLYLGFTSAVVPFGLAMAALLSGRLNNEWVVASRKWMLFAWLFLTIGNGLGMIWAYEELGWGGYWGWDPVENASLLPWLTATAYLHSIVMQERRGIFKRWNVALVSATVLLTFFGTFITRSGLIASVHAFAKSSIGTYFLAFMGLVLAGCVRLIIKRWHALRGEARLESLWSKEGAFLLHNLAITSFVLFVLVATTWPRLSEWWLGSAATVGPDFYNAFVPPLALLIVGLMAIVPILGWRRTDPSALWRSARGPVAAAVAAAAIHAVAGPKLGWPPFVELTPALPNVLGRAAAWLGGKLPVVTVAVVVFALSVIVQEIVRGVRARRQRQRDESVPRALWTLVSRSRRRYGGLVAHAGVAIMMLGFAGRAWGSKHEVSLAPGESSVVAGYTLTYAGIREDADHEKQMYFADVEVALDGRSLGRLSPARYVYRASPEQPSSEVGRIGRPLEDLYVIVGMLNRRDGMASFQVHVNPLVSFVWLGIVIICMGGMVGLWPDPRSRRAPAFGYVRQRQPAQGGAQ